MSWIDKDFPNMVGLHQITSEADTAYNCIGWAATGQKSEWWQHTPGYRWPGPNRSSVIESLVSVFVSLRYEQRPASETSVEAGYEKIALYARNGFWTHAARQLPNGKWTSKLGEDEDIEHDSAECICGIKYGTVHCIMRRKL